MATQMIIPTQVAGASAPTTFTPYDIASIDPTVGRSIEQVRAEVDDAFEQMKTFHNNEPDYCMRMASGHSARLSELRVKVMRIEDYKREWMNVRTRELEPCLHELEKQYNIASRLHSVRDLDWRMESGER